MRLNEIEQNVAEIDPSKGFGLIYDLSRAYAILNAPITRLQKGTCERFSDGDEGLWKGKVNSVADGDVDGLGARHGPPVAFTRQVGGS